jgi:negative regulator of sigma E activity
MSAELPWRAGIRRETLCSRHRSWLVHKIVRITSMILLSGVAALAVLALVTLAGVFVLQHVYPQQAAPSMSPARVSTSSSSGRATPPARRS